MRGAGNDDGSPNFIICKLSLQPLGRGEGGLPRLCGHIKPSLVHCVLLSYTKKYYKIDNVLNILQKAHGLSLKTMPKTGLYSQYFFRYDVKTE